MYIGFAVDLQGFAVGQNVCPQFFITVESPIVTVESAPQNGSAVLVKILFNCNYSSVMPDVDSTDRVVSFAADCYLVSAHNVRYLLCCIGCKNGTVLGDDSFCRHVGFKTAVIFTQAPVDGKNIAVEEGEQPFDTVFDVAFGKVTAMRVGS